MYGHLIKEIRLAKGFKQKEVYSEVVSKSFYSDFEADKYSITIEKFEGLLKNLGISYKEFNFFKEQKQPTESDALGNLINQLYSEGKFEKLYEIYENKRQHPLKDIRFLATKAYLLVLITNTNFYQFSREPFNEITAALEITNHWSLQDISLAKLVLLSYSEKQKEKATTLCNRIITELSNYQLVDSRLYYEELGDLYFNRIQSLLIINDIKSAELTLQSYGASLSQADNLHLKIQFTFISHLVNLYLDFSKVDTKLKEFLKQMKSFPTSETHFYCVIAEIHQEKARNYYLRHASK